jgi:5-methylcytosine-specific restriction protein B
MNISNETIEKLLELVRKRFPGWVSFSDERFVKDEIDYKRRASHRAQEMLNKEELARLIDHEKYDEFITELDKIGHSTNLLWTNVPMSGDLNILYQQNLDKKLFCTNIYELIHGPDEIQERLKRYIDYVREYALPNKWTFPTYFLFLCFPETEIFIKPSVVKWLIEFMGIGEKFPSNPTIPFYIMIKEISREIGLKLKNLGAKDMIDAQSIIWVGASVTDESSNKLILKTKMDEFDSLFKEFIESYPATDEGQHHLALYKSGREEARQNYANIITASENGEDVTNSVLLKLLPYNESEGNRLKGAWIHVAPAIRGDIKGWFEAKGWTNSEDWPDIAKAILDFVRRCVNEPAQLDAACKEFSSFKYAKGFQSGILTPILNALKPEDFVILNNKSRLILKHFTGKSYSQSIEEYPETNKVIKELIAELAPKIREYKSYNLIESDTYDMYCHWLIAIKKLDFEKNEYWKIAPGEAAWNWEKCREGGYIAIGWDEIGDLSGLTRKEFDDKWSIIAQKDHRWSKTAANEVWKFAHLKENDKIIANRGTTEVLGIGIVAGDYYFVPEDIHGHRVPVEWYDLSKRIIDQKGWRRTLIKLKEEDFRSIENESKIDSIKPENAPFSSRSFELLYNLYKNPSQEFYKSHLEEFKIHVEEPLQRIMKKVAANLPQPMLETIETEKKIFGKIPKNDYGKGGAWDYYWGAFYPKKGKRVEDAQLFLWINRDVLRFGFSIGNYGGAQRKLFLKNCHQYSSDILPLLKDTFPSDLKFSGPYESGMNNAEIVTAKFTDWISNPKKIGIDAAIMIEKASVLEMTEEELVNRISELFKTLFPFVILSISDEPMTAISEYLDSEPPETQPKYSLAQCAAETGFSENELKRWVQSIERKGQLIFYGPPGTGKTFIAEKLARHLIGGGDGFKDIIQFHPAYAYEDFIQGIRPRTRADGGLEYPIVEGRFLEFCRRAKATSSKCVLIIDEINRANLARVFGELMYLLEYRNEKIPLASGGDLQIPSNIRIIGTMNTADRSIALVDHALRRRFAFVALHPNYESLKNYHKNTEFDPEGLISVLKRLNNQIGDPHYEVGITFFLREDIGEQISDVWQMEIEPYLEEYFFDQRKKVDEFRWEQISKEILP